MYNITIKYKNCFSDFISNVEGFNINNKTLLMWDSYDKIEIDMAEIRAVDVELIETTPLYPNISY